MKLNLGCAKDIRDDFINIDINTSDNRVLKIDACKLSFIPDDSVSEIIAKDILEHLPFTKCEDAIKEWARVLKPGGTIFIQTINLEKQICAFNEKIWDIREFNHMLFAGINWNNNEACDTDFHKSAYTRDYLTKTLKLNGIETSSCTEDEIDNELIKNPLSHNLNLCINGIKNEKTTHIEPNYSNYKIYIDNRNTKRVDFTTNTILTGDLYKPWYYIESKITGTKFNTNSISLVFDITHETLNTDEIKITSFIEDCRKKSRNKYYDPILEKSLLKFGQINPIICTKHYTVDAKNKVTFLDGSTPCDTRCFEGHHRLVTLESMHKQVKAKIYHLYDFKEPIDVKSAYESNFSDALWKHYQNTDTKNPAFTLEQYQNPKLSMKYNYIIKCIDFLKNLQIPLNSGIDLGCAEGLYTQLLSNELNIKMHGIDIEKGRIIRALLAKIITKCSNTAFNVANWISTDTMEIYKNYDFCSALSILHHVNDMYEFLKSVSENKKAMIIEARVKDETQIINSGSMIKFHSFKSTISIFKRLKFKYELIEIGGVEKDRHFFVLWK